MAYEIEIKARISDSESEKVCEILRNAQGSSYLGKISKEDIYWHRPGIECTVLRTRRENDNGSSRVLFTAKPDKQKSPEGFETNQELEFAVSDDMWKNCLDFCSGTGLEIYRKKWKSGHHFLITVDGFEIHAELLEVRFLGWYLEMEICPGTLDGFDITLAHQALEKLLCLCSVSQDRIESRGYNAMLKEIGRNMG